MRLTCPCCGATNSLDALLNDVSARQAVATALALPANLGPRLLRYLALFRPPNRSLTWERVARLLGELQAMIDAGAIQRHGRSWTVSPAAWQAALDEMLERRHSLSLPLKSHGYLLEILAGQANQTEARQEESIEKERRTVVRRPAQDQPPDDDRLEAAKQASLRRFADLVAAQEGASSPALPPSPLAGEGRGGGASLPPAHFRNLAAQLRGTFAAESPPESDPHD